MSFWTAIALIAIAAIIFGSRHHRGSRRSEHDREMPETAVLATEREKELEREVEQLRERAGAGTDRHR